MATLNMECPLYIHEKTDRKKKIFHVQHVFDIAFSVSRHRLKAALDRMRYEIRYQYNHCVANKDIMEDMGWLSFEREIHYEKIHFDKILGRTHIMANFSLLSFGWNGKRYGIFPDFDGHMFDMDIDSNEMLETLLRDRISDGYSGEEIVEEYAIQNRAFVSSISVSLALKDQLIENETQNAFATIFGGEQDFNGHAELEKTGRCLNALYPDDLDRCLKNEVLSETVFQNIFSKERSPVMFVGPIGSGKTCLIHEAVYQYIDRRSGASKKKMREVWHMDPNRVIAGMSVIGQWERRMDAMLNYLSGKSQGVEDGILYIDNPVALFKVGQSSSDEFSLMHLLRPFLKERKIKIVFEANNDEWKKMQELDRSFCELIQIIRIEEPKAIDALKIITYKRSELEKQYECEIENRAFQTIVELHASSFGNKVQPGRTLDFLKPLAAKFNEKEINRDHVLSQFHQIHHLNEIISDSTRSLSREECKGFFASHIISQEEAVECLCDAILNLKSGLLDPRKPIGTYLFVGPTGVGKTEAAKAIAKFLFNHTNSLIRIDLNEYVDEDAVSRLIGDFYHPGGHLVDAVRAQNFNVILFDEIEKAHPDVHDLLLQVLGEGRITDGSGQTVSLTKSIIIMTSNLGADRVMNSISLMKNQEPEKEIYVKAAKDYFRPEFFNRIDRVVCFKPLGLEAVKGIARLQITQLLQRHGFSRRMSFVNISDTMVEDVAREGYDPILGARALKRNIERRLTRSLAHCLNDIDHKKPLLLDLQSNQGQVESRIQSLAYCDRLESKEFKNAKMSDESLLDATESLTERMKELLKDKTFDSNVSQHYSKDEMHQVDLALMLSDMCYELKKSLQQRIWQRNQPKSHVRYVKKVHRPISPSTWHWTAFSPNSLSELDRNILSLAWEDAVRCEQSDVISIPNKNQLNYTLAKGLEYSLKDCSGESLNLNVASLSKDPCLSECKALKNHFYQFLKAVPNIQDDEWEQLDHVSAAYSHLLKYEQGIHLFMRHQKPPALIQCSLSSASEIQEKLEIIRVWKLNEKGEVSECFDIRSGLIGKPPWKTFDVLFMVLFPHLAMSPGEQS